MTNLNGRVNRLEVQAGLRDKPLLILVQDLDDPDAYMGDGRHYRRGVNWPDGEHYNLVLINWRR